MNAILLSTLLFAAAPQLSDGERAFVERVNRPVVLRLPGMEDVRVRRDLVYKNAGDVPMLADVYSPKSAPGRLPVAIFVHGGVGASFPVRPKEWGIYQSWGRIAAASGMVGVAFNHRLGFPEPHLREAASDLADMVEYVRAHAGELGADPDRIAILTYSAGGPLLSPALRGEMPGVRCIVSFYNFLDISMPIHHRQFENADVIREFSPVNFLAPDNPPMLVIKAGRDEIPTLNATIDAFVKHALEVNAPLTLVVHPTAPHGFDNDLDDARTREILETTLDFLRRHLGR